MLLSLIPLIPQRPRYPLVMDSPGETGGGPEEVEAPVQPTVILATTIRQPIILTQEQGKKCSGKGNPECVAQ